MINGHLFVEGLYQGLQAGNDPAIELVIEFFDIRALELRRRPAVRPSIGDKKTIGIPKRKHDRSNDFLYAGLGEAKVFRVRSRRSRQVCPERIGPVGIE